MTKIDTPHLRLSQEASELKDAIELRVRVERLYHDLERELGMPCVESCLTSEMAKKYRLVPGSYLNSIFAMILKLDGSTDNGTS